jgi:hypothetical protein
VSQSVYFFSGECAYGIMATDVRPTLPEEIRQPDVLNFCGGMKRG